MRPCEWCRFIPLILVFGLAPTALWATDSALDTVYFAQPNNTISKVVSFDTGETMPVIVVDGANFQGIVVRPDGLIIAANRTGGGDLELCNPATGGCEEIVNFTLAEGLDSGTGVGALVAVNEKNRILKLPYTGCTPHPTRPNCLPGGYELAPEVSISGVKKLVDVKFARGGKEIFVLVRDPRQLIKIPDLDLCGNPCKPYRAGSNPNGYRVVLNSAQLLGKEPAGFSFQGSGDVLVATKSGVVLEYVGGVGPAVEFADVGCCAAKIAVGIQGQGPLERERVFVSALNAAIRCFEENGDECGEATEGVDAPDGVGIATGAFVATAAAGAGVPVVQTLAPGLVTRWAEILSDGNSLALCSQFPDPREGNADGTDFTPEPLFLCEPNDPAVPDCQAQSGDFFVDLGLPNVIPRHVRALPPGVSSAGPFTGPPTLQVCIMSTSAGFNGIIEDHVGGDFFSNGKSWLGYDLHDLCPAQSLSSLRRYPGVLYSPGPGDRPIVEEQDIPDVFTDVTIECNHPLGGSWSRSVVVNGAWIDTSILSECEEAETKLANLDLTLQEHASNIVGKCDAGPLDVAGIPAGSDLGKMADAFSAAFGVGTDLANLSNWSLVSSSFGKFGGDGTIGNGFLLGGGTVQKKAKLAGFNHEFGSADVNYTLDQPPVVPDSGGSTVNPLAPTSDPYLLYFKNIGTGLDPGNLLDLSIFTDGTAEHPNLRIAVYQNLEDPTLFGFFFDDGVLDFDYDDLIVTATGPVGTRCALEIALDDAIEALQGSACTNTSKLSDAIGSLQEFVNVIGANEDDFPADNVDAELKARALSAIYVIDRKLPVTVP